MSDFRSRLPEGVGWHACPVHTASWWNRVRWERTHLAAVAAAHGAQVYFTPSGMAADRLPIPQVVFCQNPWALVAEARRRRDGVKAWLQRRAYRQAMYAADVMVFNSVFMQEAYRQNAGRAERRGLVVYQAADEATIVRAGTTRTQPRLPGRVVCASAMGRHKNVETAVRAIARIRREGVRQAHLVVVGAWPDPAYRREVESLIRSLDLGSAVSLVGHVSREMLDDYYATAMAFCLMSRCESFGIPAVEAQLFGTPVVSSKVCAIPEVCGEGGIYTMPDDDAAVASALHRLLTDQEAWLRSSQAARANASRFAWSRCSAPLVELFEAWGRT